MNGFNRINVRTNILEGFGKKYKVMVHVQFIQLKHSFFDFIVSLEKCISFEMCCIISF